MICVSNIVKMGIKRNYLFQLASDPGASLQGYTRKKLYIEHGDVFFCFMPL